MVDQGWDFVTKTKGLGVEHIETGVCDGICYRDLLAQIVKTGAPPDLIFSTPVLILC
jgi:hypothetical protein